MPIMLGVRDGKPGAVAELAPYNRDSLDPAILLASLVGQTEIIDTLTNYGASVYARMEDGRTPLMIAAENGHTESVKLLLDIGASRFSTDAEGRSATDLANAGGHAEIVALISRDPLPEELALESPAEIGRSMDAFVDAALADVPPATEQDGIQGSTEDAIPTLPDSPTPSPAPSRPIQGEVLSAAVEAPEVAAVSSPDATPSAPTGSNPASPAPAAANASASPSRESFPLPPLVMRHYREREMPVQVRSVDGESATLAIAGPTAREVIVSPGDTLPGSNLVVVRVQRRMEDSKLNLGQSTEVSVVEVRDTTTQTTREWISGVPSNAHDPVALVEDAATGQRYTATPGQRFTSADGSEFIVADVRPNQIIIEDAATGAVQTIPLRGPRG